MLLALHAFPVYLPCILIVSMASFWHEAAPSQAPTKSSRLTNLLDARTGNSFCPRTHTPLNDWICVRSNDDLRARITAWAEQCGIDLDALISAQYAKAASAQ